MNRHRIHLSLLSGLIIMSGTLGLASEHYEVVIERAVEARMRDGTVLRADIYEPAVDGKFPVLLHRTPYDKRGGVDFGLVEFCLRAASEGYVVILQDVRGRYTSEGEWDPFRHEAHDGYDTVEWAAALPKSNGKVGMFGGSYCGATQMLAATTAPPHLAGIFPDVTGSSAYEGMTYRGGAFEQWLNESWTSLYLAPDTLNRRLHVAANVVPRLLKLPLASYPLFDPGFDDNSTETAQGLAPYFINWLSHPSYDEYWKQVSIEDHFSQFTYPIFHIGAWYDIFLGGTLMSYLGLKAHAGSEAARRGQRLLMMTGGHAGPGPRIGEVDFGASSVVDEFDLTLRWYDHLLKGRENGLESEKPVKLFVMGKNVWREEDDWPLARARNTRFYLHSQGKSNSLAGDGTLSTDMPTQEPADQYVYDPSDPVPTRGGQLCCDGAHMPPGAIDQRPVEVRNDVLVYSTPPFNGDFEVTGPVSVELYVSSSAVDTDFTGKLVDVWPNGFAQNLTEGILRARYRNSQETVEFMNPGET